MTQPITNAEKARAMREAISNTMTSFYDEGRSDLANQTSAAVQPVLEDETAMARLWDIMQRGYGREQAIAAIEAGEV